MAPWMEASLSPGRIAIGVVAGVCTTLLISWFQREDKKLDQIIGRGFGSAFKAGWIANRCIMCRIDNDEQMIYPCYLHKDEIARLASVNEEKQR